MIFIGKIVNGERGCMIPPLCDARLRRRLRPRSRSRVRALGEGPWARQGFQWPETPA